MRTRGRFITEALPTTWSTGSPLPEGLLARVLSWLRKKLPFEALKVGLPVEGGKQGRVTRCSFSLGKNKSPMDRNLVLQPHPRNPSDERDNESCQAYRQNLTQHADITYMELENPIWLSQESANLRPMPDRGRSPRSSPRLGKPTPWRRGAVGNNAVQSKLSRRKDV
jgi:hypothetical protein